MNDTFDVISIGDTTTDTFLELEEASVACDVDRENCKLLLNYADKIPVKSLQRSMLAGNAANNAIGSARLGLKTAIYTIVGDDSVGHDIKSKLESEGVNCNNLIFDGEHGTNSSTIITFKGERTILAFHEPREYLIPELPETKWFYFTSVARGHEKLHEQISKLVEEGGIKLAFNPGTYQLREGLENIKPIFENTSVLILNKEEGERLVGDVNEIRDLLSRLKRTGPEIVVVTDSSNGSYAYDGNRYLHIGVLDGDLVERTGAGDAFATALVASTILGNDISESLKWGTVNANSVLKFVGSQHGLLTREEIEQKISENPQLMSESF